MIESTKTDWEKLETMSDADIDFTDIPETDEKFWDDSDIIASRKKVEFTIKIDEDLASWLKKMGVNSDMAVNHILRAYYLTKTH